MNPQNTPEPAPQPKAPDVRQSAHWLVCADLMDRAAMGQQKYGVPLMVDNGRDHMMDGYQELLDHLCYRRMEIEQRRIHANTMESLNAIPLSDDALAAECAARGWGVIRPTQGAEAPVLPSELPHDAHAAHLAEFASESSEYALRKYAAYGQWLRSGRHDEEWGDGYEAGRNDALETVPSPALDFAEYLVAQRDWSARTFGPGMRTQGIVAHIRKELEEILAKPDDIEEWVDVLILACDGAWRTGVTISEIIQALVRKIATNQARTWPDWRTLPQDQPSEHMRNGAMDAAATPGPPLAPEEEAPNVLDVCLTCELARAAGDPWSFQHVRERLGELGIPLEGLWGDHSAEVRRREPRWKAAGDTTQEVHS